ncbi:hypothetical protein ACLG6S_09065 [Thermodesulfobacteriota bacterium B35]
MQISQANSSMQTAMYQSQQSRKGQQAMPSSTVLKSANRQIELAGQLIQKTVQSQAGMQMQGGPQSAAGTQTSEPTRDGRGNIINVVA